MPPLPVISPATLDRVRGALWGELRKAWQAFWSEILAALLAETYGAPACHGRLPACNLASSA